MNSVARSAQGREALVDGGDGVDGRGLDRNAWVVREGGSGLDELGCTI
jgi:hypothetical protein